MKRRLAVTLLAMSLGLSAASSVAQEPEREPTSPIERLKLDLKGIGNNITNATMRIRRNMAGMSKPEEQAPQPPPTPAETCCRPNIERINKKIEIMTRTLEQLYVYYTERRDSQALQVIDTIQAELHAISRGVAIFRMEGSKDSAQQALAGLLRPFNRLRKAIDELAACCAVDPALWAEPPPARPQS